MKILCKMQFPAETFTSLARAGGLGQKMGALLEATKPESLYFTGNGCGRGAVAVYEVEDGSQIPALVEPWLLTFNARVDYDLAITPEEMGRAGLDEVVKKWA